MGDDLSWRITTSGPLNVNILVAHARGEPCTSITLVYRYHGDPPEPKP
jgi:hypothetical protein